MQIEDVPLFELKMVQVQYGTENIPTATATVVTPEGNVKNVVATGSGSVELFSIRLNSSFQEPLM